MTVRDALATAGCFWISSAALAGPPGPQAQTPLRFVPHPTANAFVAQGNGYALLAEADQVRLHLLQPTDDDRRALAASVAVRFPGAAADAPGRPELPLTTRSHYLTGSSSNWRQRVANYARVRFSEVFPGIDIVHYGHGRQLEFDFVVAPGADPSQAALAFEGVSAMALDATGGLELTTAAGVLVQHAPIVYQEHAGVRRAVEASYLLGDDGVVRFQLGPYDRRQALVIDPILQYARTQNGQQEDRAQDVAVDAAGNAYLVGYTISANFASGRVFDEHLGPAPRDGQVGTVVARDAFVSKVAPNGDVLFTTYLGGIGDERGWAIELDARGCPVICGQTFSDNFPTTPGAYSTAPFSNGSPRVGEGFVSKLDPNGTTLLFSTLIGDADAPRADGSFGTVTAEDAALDLAIAGDGSIYVVGETRSPLFPTTPGALDRHYGAEPVPGQVGGLVDPGDGFCAHLSADGSQLLASTFLGGGFFDFARSCALDPNGALYVTGQTKSEDFPTTPGAFQSAAFAGASTILGDAFVAKLDPGLSMLYYATYLGDADVERQPDPRYGAVNGADFGTSIAVDAAGCAYVAGGTFSPHFPTTSGAYDNTLDTRGVDGQHGDISSSDGFVAKMNRTGTALVWSTYIGGDGSEFANDLAVAEDGSVIVVGSTSAFEDFPDTERTIGKQGYFNASITDAFVLRLLPDGSDVDWSVRFGGASVDDAQGLARAPSGDVYVAGYTHSDDFLDPNYDPDALFVRTSFGAATEPSAYVTRFAPRSREVSPAGVGPVVPPVSACIPMAVGMFSLTLAGLVRFRR